MAAAMPFALRSSMPFEITDARSTRPFPPVPVNGV